MTPPIPSVTVQPPDADGTNGTEGSVTMGSAAVATAGNASIPSAQNKIREEDIQFPVGVGAIFTVAAPWRATSLRQPRCPSVRDNVKLRDPAAGENSRSAAAGDAMADAV